MYAGGQVSKRKIERKNKKTKSTFDLRCIHKKSRDLTSDGNSPRKAVCGILTLTESACLTGTRNILIREKKKTRSTRDDGRILWLKHTGYLRNLVVGGAKPALFLHPQCRDDPRARAAVRKLVGYWHIAVLWLRLCPFEGPEGSKGRAKIGCLCFSAPLSVPES